MGQATAIEADPFPRATTPEARAYWRPTKRGHEWQVIGAKLCGECGQEVGQ